VRPLFSLTVEVFLANESIRARAADAAVQSRGTLTITLGDSASSTLALSTLAQGTLGARDGARLGKQGRSTVRTTAQSLLRCCPLAYFAAVPTSVRPPHPPAPQSADLYTLCGMLPCRRHLHSRQATATSSQSRPLAHTRAVIALCAPWPGPLAYTHTPWLHCADHGRSLFDRVLTVLFCPCHVSTPTCGYSLRNSQSLTAVHCEKCAFFCVPPANQSRQPLLVPHAILQGDRETH
jgi:hypothetical protein